MTPPRKTPRPPVPPTTPMVSDFTGKRSHPTLSDVALALATRRTEPSSKFSISDENAKGVVQIGVEVSDTDPARGAKTAADLYDVLRARYPRETTPR